MPDLLLGVMALPGGLQVIGPLGETVPAPQETATAVPEPESWMLFCSFTAMGLLTLFLTRARGA
jgi:hypothetical protein